MTNQTPLPTVKLSALARLYWTIGHELRLDKGVIFDSERYANIVKMYQFVEHRRDALFRNLVILDAIVAVLLLGKSITLPVVGLSLADFPAAREVSTMAAGLMFQYGIFAFVNYLAYGAIIKSINERRAEQAGLDRDYVGAGERQIEFVPKLFQATIRTIGSDILIPGRGYKVVGKIIVVLAITSVVGFILLHLGLTVVSAIHSYLALGNHFLTYVYLILLGAINISAVLTIAMMQISFKFTVTEAGLK